VIPVQVVRAQREERLLAETFGSEFAAYRESTWF
jgi:protein-S-isoprenylcysteine O-methyltransferase Ste14